MRNGKTGRAFFNWSGGKDSALALHRHLASHGDAVFRLLTTVSEKYDRVSMHGVRSELLDMQAERIGIPLMKVILPDAPDMTTYERVMEESLQKLKIENVRTAIFGDIFLEDLRTYREKKLAELGFKCLFPLWKTPTGKLMMEFIDLGFKAVTVCVDERYLDRSFVGVEIDSSFVNNLPPNVDPCGENGEFHSFVYDGPIFNGPVRFNRGEIVHRNYYSHGEKNRSDTEPRQDHEGRPDPGFWYCDLIPV